MTLLSALPHEFRLIGGLAVMCRVGMPHRTTVDLDVVTRDLSSHHAEVSRLAVTASTGGQYTFAGGLDLDVIDVAPEPVAGLLEKLGPGPLTDLELNVVAHTWAHDTATPLDVVAVDDRSLTVLAMAPDRLVATSLGLVAMKVTTVPLRASSKPQKQASDLYDLGRLLVAGGLGTVGLGECPSLLRDVIAERLERWFVDGAGRDRTYRLVRRFDEPALDLDEAAEAAAELIFEG
ncbi:MAG: nucleotidyl transferase AbiEii/AbiGii toxin family protein [Acidimicrobiales bacterium]|nr:nucleotidyl transferase AbiEii/AbiGii toxin family protein [Acidimicrobiales bacterium]